MLLLSNCFLYLQCIVIIMKLVVHIYHDLFLVSINSDKNSFSQFPSHLIYSDYKMIAVNFI